MENLLTKSREHLNAANILHQTKCYSSVPHCSYYACFQLFIYIMSMDQSFEGKDSHNKLINLVEDEVYRRDNEDYSALDFNNDITKLKKERSLADYKTKIFYDRESRKNINVATRLTANLANIFNIK
nr:MAG TPA: hypothetical protein [Caudoviricetes sp.]